MCNLTILSILQKPNKTPTECTHTLAYEVMKRVKKCTRAIRVCSFTAWFSRLKCIKNDRKIQDLGAEMYIFTFHIVKNHTKGAVFSSKISMITSVILILYNSSRNNKLILRDLCFRHHIACFCCIHFCCVTALFWVSVIRSWMIRSFKWFGSVATTHLLPVTCCHLLAV